VQLDSRIFSVSSLLRARTQPHTEAKIHHTFYNYPVIYVALPVCEVRCTAALRKSNRHWHLTDHERIVFVEVQTTHSRLNRGIAEIALRAGLVEGHWSESFPLWGMGEIWCACAKDEQVRASFSHTPK
jgi:hypothetical protein